MNRAEGPRRCHLESPASGTRKRFVPRPTDGAWRSRYAAFGAAVAVSLSGGAIAVTLAASDPAPSTFVPITPCRIMDTRTSTNVGPRTTPVLGGTPYTIQILGTNGNCSIPANATAVNMNVTSVNPSAAGFLTVWPSTSARPLSSSLNWTAGQAPTPNSVNAALGSTGQVSFYASAGVVDLVADVTGYYLPAGAPTTHPARVLWVATSGGDFTSLKAALASISDNDPLHPYVIRIAPGTYDEPGGVDLKSNVDVEGSGRDTTTITCTCGSPNSPSVDASSATVRVAPLVIAGELRDVKVVNTGGSTYSTAIRLAGLVSGFSLLHVAAGATGGVSSLGVWVDHSSPFLSDVNVFVDSTSTPHNTEAFGVTLATSFATLDHITIIAFSSALGVGVFNYSQSGSSMTDVSALGSGANGYGILNDTSSATIEGSLLRGAGAASIDVSNTNGAVATIRNSTMSASKSVKNDATSSADIVSSGLDTAIGPNFACVADYKVLTFAPLNSACN